MKSYFARSINCLCCVALCLLVCCGSRKVDDNKLFDLAARSGESANLRERAIRELGSRGRQDLLLGLLKRYRAEDELFISDVLAELRGANDETVYSILLDFHRRITEEGIIIHGETNAQLLDAIKRFKGVP